MIAATLARFALSPFAPNLTFVTYYPAVLICSLLAGWHYGTACTILSGILANSLFPDWGPLRIGDLASLTALIVFFISCAIIVATADALRRAVRDLDRAAEVAGTLNKELQHRVRNMLTVVQGLAIQSARAASPEAFVEALSGRLQALAKAHELLGQRSLETCTLPELVDEACLPFCDGDNIIRRGPACELPAVSCVPLVLALHELCTNAVKYGALSNSDGRVEIKWSFGDPQRLVIEWKELGGPAVFKPEKKGLGSALLRRQSGIADVAVTFEQSGVRCQISIDGAQFLDTSKVTGFLPEHELDLLR